MAKGRQGNFHKPKLTSSSGLFEKRGDKWGGRNVAPSNPHPITEAEKAVEAVLAKMAVQAKPKSTSPKKEPAKWTKRIVSVEESKPERMSGRYAAEEAELRRRINSLDDPDMDQFIKARKAEPKPEYIGPTGQKIENTVQRKISQRLSRMHQQIRHKAITTTDNKRAISEVPLSSFDSLLLGQKGNVTEARIAKDADALGSREKARKRVLSEKEERLNRMADYMAKKMGRG